MSDLALRKAQRDAATGDLPSRVRVLQGRLRAGEPGPLVPVDMAGALLPPFRMTVNKMRPVMITEHLKRSPEGHETRWTETSLRAAVELAACCGDEAARTVLGEDAYRLVEGSTGGWPNGLSRWGRYVCVRAVVTASRASLDSLRADWHIDTARVHYRTQIAEPEQVIEAAEAWLTCPCGEHRRMWSDAWRLAGDSPRGWLPYPSRHKNLPAQQIVRVVARPGGGEGVVEAICADLIGWALC